MNPCITINLNDYVLVKLTQLGLRIHVEDHERFFGAIPAMARYPYALPAVDAEGYTRFPLWELMRLFGSSMTMGFDVPFETTIRLLPTFAGGGEGSGAVPISIKGWTALRNQEMAVFDRHFGGTDDTTKLQKWFGWIARAMYDGDGVRRIGAVANDRDDASEANKQIEMSTATPTALVQRLRNPNVFDVETLEALCEDAAQALTDAITERDYWGKRWHETRRELAELKYPGRNGVIKPKGA